MATLYYKQGRRYIPCHDTAAHDGLHDGKWLVIVERGCRTTRALLDTRQHSINLAAVLSEFEDQLAAVIMEASRGEVTRKLTRREQRAWRAWAEVLGEDACITITRPSAVDIAHRAIEAIKDKIAICAEGQKVSPYAD
jgi:hypothetical protein